MGKEGKYDLKLAPGLETKDEEESNCNVSCINNCGKIFILHFTFNFFKINLNNTFIEIREHLTENPLDILKCVMVKFLNCLALSSAVHSFKNENSIQILSKYYYNILEVKVI